MKIVLSAILKNMKEMVDPRNLPFLFREVYGYIKDWFCFVRQYKGGYPVKMMPILFEKTSFSSFDPHYTYQAYWAASWIDKLRTKDTQPHIDISSNISFVAQLCAANDVIQVEYRPAKLSLPSYKKVSGDILKLPFSNESILSVSCLHVIEHIGLGRYGDSINANGCWKALSELERIIAPGGRLYLSVPIGKPAVFFNGCYIFRAMDIVMAFAGLALVDFSYVNDDAVLIESGKIEDTSGLEYGLGLFVFQK
ncbi:MAG: hypothetical protein DRH26_13645 [Deltaproteobacteria bacterium]|nr:MAG: hypothetical protein DRH26_13645 [Deltaproteobacteria bacterium]